MILLRMVNILFIALNNLLSYKREDKFQPVKNICGKYEFKLSLQIKLKGLAWLLPGHLSSTLLLDKRKKGHLLPLPPLPVRLVPDLVLSPRSKYKSQ